MLSRYWRWRKHNLYERPKPTYNADKFMAQNKTSPVAVGIDLGSSAVRCVIGVHEEEAPAPSIIGVGVAPTNGIRKGVVHDVANTVSAITAAIDEAERISGVTISGATVGVNGQHLITASSRGIVAVGSANREITQEDIARVEEAATVMQLPPNREIIQIFPRNYTVDGQEHVKDPIGMSGMRLEVDTCLVTAATPFLKNTTRSVNQAGVTVNLHSATVLAAARTVANAQDKEIGCTVIDIGTNTTGVAVYEEGEVLHAAVIPVGAAHVTNDIAIGLRTEIETAEAIKLEHVDADPRTAHANEGFMVKELNGEMLNVTRAEVNEIAQARLQELFDLINRELGKVKRDGMLPGGALLCGGGANLTGIAELAKQQLRLPVHIKSPRGFSGIVDKIQNPEFATVIGLMLEDMQTDHAAHSTLNLSSIVGNLQGRWHDIFDRFR
ncbi:MAG: cell division protein FtsA [Candidatus Saccharimonadales bacterium]